MRVQQNEGCDVYGYLEVNKVAGNFHFAPGKSFQQQHVHGNFIEKCLHIMFVSFNCLTRWVPLVEQEPHTVSVHLRTDKWTNNDPQNTTQKTNDSEA
jgi:hypothetical protein